MPTTRDWLSITLHNVAQRHVGMALHEGHLFANFPIPHVVRIQERYVFPKAARRLVAGDRTDAGVGIPQDESDRRAVGLQNLRVPSVEASSTTITSRAATLRQHRIRIRTVLPVVRPDAVLTSVLIWISGTGWGSSSPVCLAQGGNQLVVVRPVPNGNSDELATLKTILASEILDQNAVFGEQNSRQIRRGKSGSHLAQEVIGLGWEGLEERDLPQFPL